jgi:hypothetical protein
MSHGELACEISITSQALAWQMKCLKKPEFILHANEGMKAFYSLEEASAPMLKKCMFPVEETGALKYFCPPNHMYAKIVFSRRRKHCEERRQRNQ